MMTSWFKTIRNIYRTKELRTRLYNTLFYVVIFRIGIYIFLPGIDPTAVQPQDSSAFLKFLDVLLNSTALSRMTIFSLGISPYISASIITQITSLTIPYFQRLKKEGPTGRNQLNQITRYITLAMAPIQASVYAKMLSRPDMTTIDSFYFYPIAILTLTAGTMCCVWLADRITAKGIGSGSSILITANIVSGLLGAIISEYRHKDSSLLFLVIELLILLVIITITIAFMQGVRKIPLQYATQMAGPDATYRGARQYLPIGLNTAGVMPIIFAQTITAMPLMVARWLSDRSELAKTVTSILQNPYSWQYNAILCTLIFMGSFFYASIFVNATEMADELKRSNAFIPGIKSGKNVAEFIDKVLSWITFPGSIFLVLITLIPVFAHKFVCYDDRMSRYFGGTSMLIAIGVILDAGQKIDSHLFTMKYKGELTTFHPHLISNTK